MIKKIVRKLLDKLNLRAVYCLMKDGYLVDSGWLRSFREKKSVDKTDCLCHGLLIRQLILLRQKLIGK